MTRHIRVPVVGRALAPVGSEFVSVEALGGTVLLVATVAGFVWANAAGRSYDDLWARQLTLGWHSFAMSQDLRHWVNDGLMTVFFFVVGLEIKRELVRGELRDRRAATLPVAAAVGGMVVPVLLYLAVNAGDSAGRGWAVPMATDIAFAAVMLSVLGSRVPPRARLFLLTLAIVDDIGAILVIAFFYSKHVDVRWLVGAAAFVVLVVIAQRLGIGHPLLYVVPALALWVCTRESGVHATLAGVVLGILTPARPVGRRDVLDGLLRRLHPWSSLLVIPLFALANAGVHLDGATLARAATSRIAWGVVVGLVVGKPLGIMIATTVSLRFGLGRLPEGLTLRHVFGLGCVAGIGFTVSLFVADLSFQGARLGDAKVGIVAASLLSGLVGAVAFAALRSSPPGAGGGERPGGAVASRR
jgi:NhaA family Na+:H+ antiporter